jgi:hypothetical protein
MGIRCVNHRINLAIQSLGGLIFIAKIKSFKLDMYGYFNHSPKWHLEFQKLAQIMETNGSKILKK